VCERDAAAGTPAIWGLSQQYVEVGTAFNGDEKALRANPGPTAASSGDPVREANRRPILGTPPTHWTDCDRLTLDEQLGCFGPTLRSCSACWWPGPSAASVGCFGGCLRMFAA
ncbi:hypothetical protein, partial [Streptacidiphilus melanogenes]|uniref:hypothetical protein n=1 Tax=Streptacidiphilus melanogenes TaxID=411235 RepID=UPI001F3AA39C